MSTIFLEVTISIILILLFINVSIFAQIILILLYIIILSILLAINGSLIFSIILLAVEIHVSYLLFCYALLHVNYDSLYINNLKSSQLLISTRVMLIIFSIIGYTILIIYNLSNYYFNIDIYSIILLLNQYTDLYQIQSNSTLAILTILVRSYLTVNSFEFFLVNLCMLLAIYIYYHITQVSHINTVILRTWGIYNITKFFKFKISLRRTSRQSTQLLRSVHIIAKNSRLK
jgi:hypothetical protein